MKRLTFLLIFAASLGHAQTTTITASNIAYFGGAPITGQFCLSPTDAYGNPVNLTTTTGQQFPANPPLCFTVTAGTLQSGATVPDVSTTQPVNACYKVQILNATGSTVGKYPCIQPKGTTWSFDSYIPSNAPSIPYYQPIIAGVTGINSTIGALTFVGSGFSQSGNTFTFNGGGATTPATTNLLKGNGSANGVTTAAPGTDYAVPVTASAQYQVPLASGSGTTYVAGFVPWGAFANQLSNLSITQGSHTSTFANTLPFTTGQFNQNWILNSGNVNFATEFQAFQNAFTTGTYYASDEENIGLNVPSSSSSYQADGLGFYLTCASTTTDCVPFYTQGHRTATGAPVWGANVNAWDGGFGGANMFGFEIDDIVGNTTTTGEDLRILTKVIPGATFQGIHFVPATGVLTNAILLDNSVATNAINIGEAVGGATSMPIIFNDSTTSSSLVLKHLCVAAVDCFEFGAPIESVVNTTTSAVGSFVQQSATTPYAVLQTQGNVSFQGVDVTQAFDWSLSFGPQSSLGGANPYFSVYSGGWKTAWYVTASNQATTFAGAVTAPSVAIGTAGQATIDGSGNATLVGIAGSGLLGISNPTASSSLLEGSFYAPSLNTGGQMYFNFGEAASTNNSVYQAFHYAGSGSASNWYGSSFAGVTANNYALWPNASAVFGETTPAAGPANGIAVGTSGQFQVNASGQALLPVTTPADTATCTKGQILGSDGSYLYVCTATNTVGRVTISTY